jgi:hypothetical protein
MAATTDLRSTASDPAAAVEGDPGGTAPAPDAEALTGADRSAAG